MKIKTKIDTIVWLQKQHKINVKPLQKQLNKADFNELISYIYKIKQINSVVSPKDLIEEVLLEKRSHFIPEKNGNGENLDFHLFRNILGVDKFDYCKIPLKHILYNAWKRPTRENYRVLRKHFIESGYRVEKEIPLHSADCRPTTFVYIKESFQTKLPENLKNYSDPIKQIKNISCWLYSYQPKIIIEEENYKIKNLGTTFNETFCWWFHSIYEKSEMTYLYKNPLRNHKNKKIRKEYEWCYDLAPPVFVILEQTIKEMLPYQKLEDWLTKCLNETLKIKIMPKDMPNIIDYVQSNLAKSLIQNQKVTSTEYVYGWLCILSKSILIDYLTSIKAI